MSKSIPQSSAFKILNKSNEVILGFDVASWELSLPTLPSYLSSLRESGVWMTARESSSSSPSQKQGAAVISQASSAKG